ncbi:MAG TPA: amidohydrolase family protein [Mycobacterium sp.]|nr:amidohydrolase family protein [Mycobacterium sp.]
MTEQFRDAPVFDADQHMYETGDALIKYLPEKYKRAVQYAQFGKQTRIVINNHVTDFIPNPTFERVAAPGAHEKFFAGVNTEGQTLREMQGKAIEAPAATRNPGDRVAELDRQGVVEALNYPTLGSLVEHSSADDPALTLAIIHALNEWIHEHWSFNYDNRVFTTPIINLSEVDAAQRELAWLLERGAKVALIKPGPVNGLHGWRSPALSEFDPFWRDVEAAGLPIVLHASYPPLDDYVSRWEPPHTQNFMAQSAFRWMVLGHREIADMITSLICHGTLTRFPRLRIASVENGSGWIFPLFNDFEDLQKKMPQNFPEHPHDVFRRNIWVSPFWEGCVSDVVNTVGWDKVMFGSDYPHPEGLAEPNGFWKYAEGMDVRRTYDFMGDNARRFMGLPIANPDPEAVNPPVMAKI